MMLLMKIMMTTTTLMVDDVDDVDDGVAVVGDGINEVGKYCDNGDNIMMMIMMMAAVMMMKMDTEETVNFKKQIFSIKFSDGAR